MITRGMMTSEHDDWETPQNFFDQLNAEFHFDADVCATPENAKCGSYFTPEADGLKQEWNSNKVYWCNPPYGRKIGAWITKAFAASRAGATVICLVPARTDTAWWHDYCMKGEIRFIRGRLYFKRKGARSAAPFPSAVVIFRPT